MDHSYQGFSASNCPKPSATPKSSISGETDENHIELDQMDSKTHNSKKPVTKHFMSPTISATSKATVPRKKNLAEKNESLTSFDIHTKKSPKLQLENFNCDRSSSRAISAYNCISESKDDDENNYLSPRPKYLRYNPNSRLEIFDGQEPQEEKGDVSFLQNTSSFNSQNAVDKNSWECGLDSLSCPPQEGSAELENHEILKAEDDSDDGVDDDDDEKKEEEEEDETEEFEEEKGWSLKGALKFLLLLIVISLSTSYISSMNGPTPSLIQQAVWNVRDGCYRIEKHFYEARSTNQNTSTHEMESSTETGEAQIDFLELNKQNSYVELGSFQMVVGAEDELVESSDDIVKILEPPKWQNEDISDNEFARRDESMGNLFGSQTIGFKDADHVQVEFKEVEFDWPERKISESKVLNGEMDMIEDGSYQVSGLARAKTDESTEQVSKTVEQDSQQIEVRETLEKFESFEEFNKPLHSKRMDDQHTKFGIGSTCGYEKPADLIYEVDELRNNHKVEQNEEIFRKKEAAEMVAKGLERTVEIMRTMEVETRDRVEIVEATFGRKTRDTIVNAKWLGHESAHEDTLVPARTVIDNTGPDESRFETKEESVKPRYVELGLVPTASIWFSIFAIVVTFVVYVYRPRAIQAPVENSQPVIVPSEESERNEKLIQVHHHIEMKHAETKVESIVKPSSMLFSTGEAVEELSDIQAPEIQLLGELVIGKVSSSCSRRSKVTETEESIKVISHVESPVAPSAEPSTLDTASSDSPSYGSFTAEKKILKKEGTDGDVKILTTPVRRSSRTRNRSVTSP